jgi:hypothetical protein
LVDEAMRNDPGITLDQFLRDGNIAPQIRKAADQVGSSVEIDVSLIVAGFYNNQPVQFIVDGGKTVTVRPEITPGNATIGSGNFAASNWPNYRKQNRHTDLARSTLHLTEAKQFAEVERTVGPFRQMVVLWSGGCKPIDWSPELQHLLEGWWARYGLPLSDGLEDEKYNQALRKMFGLGS